MRLLVIACFVFLNLSCSSASDKESSLALASQGSGKAVVFDAGSSGTRIYVYDWARPESSDAYPVLSLPAGRSKKVSPGLSTLSTDQIPDYLNSLINFAKQIVGSDAIARTPIYFGGTAGLRLLKEREPANFAAIMAKTKEVVEGSGFLVSREVAPITGEEEGAYAWIAVNGLDNRLNAALFGVPDSSVGIVEMGGASFQMAYLPTSAPAEHAFDVNLAGKHIVLYAYSYGDLGENEARDRFSDTRNCEWNGDFVSDLVDFKSDFDLCRSAILTNIETRLGQECLECGIGSIYQPLYENLSKTFYALGSLGFLGSEYGINPVNEANIEAKGREVCNKTYSESRMVFPSVSDDIARKLCFNLAYYASVLSGEERPNFNGIGFPASATNVISIKDINGQEETWTYGLLLVKLDAALRESL